MRVPGFSAEASLGTGQEPYRQARIPNTVDPFVYQAEHFDIAGSRPLPMAWPIVLGRPIFEPSCVCLSVSSQGRCLRWICF
jgi:hypothetical protein